MADIAFIVADSGSLTGNETTFKNRMDTTLGHDVTLIDSSDAETTDFSPYNAVVISPSCTISEVDGLKTLLKPLLIISGDQWCADFEMSSTETYDVIQTVIDINDNSHYITENFSTGDLTVYSSGDHHFYGQTIPGDLSELASKDGNTSRVVLITAEKNDTLDDSSACAERRVYWGVKDASRYTSNAWTIFDRSITWLLYQDGGETYTKNFTETITLSESLTKDVTKVFSEDITLSEALTKDIGKVFSEDITLSESLERVVAYIRNFTETITLSEVLAASLGVTLKEKIINEINSTYTIDTNIYNITKRYGRINILSANLKEYINLFYNWSRDHDFLDGFGAIRTKKLVLTMNLVAQLDDNYSAGHDKIIGLMRAILSDLRQNLDDAISSTYNAFFITHTQIQDIATPNEKQFQLHKVQTKVEIGFIEEEGV